MGELTIREETLKIIETASPKTNDFDPCELAKLTKNHALMQS